MNTEQLIYLILHALLTIGGLFLFFLKIEHRLTKLETKVNYIEKKLSVSS